MRSLLLACLVGSAAHAQVIECPKPYPSRDAPLAEAPDQHRDQGFAAKAELSGAAMYAGEVNGRGELQGDARQVKGGWDIEYGFGAEPKWLVCRYGKGGDITWWEQIDSRVTHCTLKMRDEARQRVSAGLTCR